MILFAQCFGGIMRFRNSFVLIVVSALSNLTFAEVGGHLPSSSIDRYNTETWRFVAPTYGVDVLKVEQVIEEAERSLKEYDGTVTPDSARIKNAKTDLVLDLRNVRAAILQLSKNTDPTVKEALINIVNRYHALLIRTVDAKASLGRPAYAVLYFDEIPAMTTKAAIGQMVDYPEQDSDAFYQMGLKYLSEKGKLGFPRAMHKLKEVRNVKSINDFVDQIELE